MLIVFSLWLLVLFVCLVTGYSVFVLIGRVFRNTDYKPDFAELFFLGFLTVSLVTGYLSVWLPVGKATLIIILLVSLFLGIISWRGIYALLKNLAVSVRTISMGEVVFVLFIFAFVLLSVAQRITWGDTESYHVQAIKWIREYPVVPGLGNIHGRFAFNSMFFVVSALFTFRIGDILIFPVNGIAYLVLAFKLFDAFRHEMNNGEKWKAVFFALALLMSMMFLLPSLNSPSADAICGIIIMYVFFLLSDYKWKDEKKTIHQLILLNLLVFSCIAFKLSSAFIVLALLITLDRRPLRRGILSLITGIMVLIPFFVRNFYLSGYLAYPFPAVDIFNVDWKIPYENVLSMKQEIEGWAKISAIPYSEVISMGVGEWIAPWFRSLGFNDKLLVAGNALTVVWIFIMILKRRFLVAMIQIVLSINLLFWFLMAPDIRFAFGFLFTGFALSVASVILLIEGSSVRRILKLTTPAMILVLLLVAGRRIEAPADTLKNPELWILPASFGKVETELYSTNFEYRVPVERGGCLDTGIPCVPFPFDNIILRGENIQQGFRVDTSAYSGIHYID